MEFNYSHIMSKRYDTENTDESGFVCSFFIIMTDADVYVNTIVAY